MSSLKCFVTVFFSLFYMISDVYTMKRLFTRPSMRNVQQIPEFEIKNEMRREFNFGNNDIVYEYQNYKNKLLSCISNSRLDSISKKNKSSKISDMRIIVETIIRNAKEIEEKNLSITKDSQLDLFNKTIETLNSFFDYSLKNIVKKYNKIYEEVKKSEETFFIESINKEYVDYKFLNSVKFSEEFKELYEMHVQMQKYILLFFDWLHLFLIYD